MQNLFFGQLNKSGPFSLGLASLCVSISHVVGWGAKKQMAGIATVPYVAFVANAHPNRDWPAMQFVRKAVDFFKRVGCRVNSSVPVFVTVADPKPTIVFSGHDKFAPKALRYGDWFRAHAAMLTQSPLVIKGLA